jgi:hypothetical protein
MLPEDLANKHPRLYHITRPNVVPSIRKHGLLTTRALLDLFEVASSEREMIETRRRPLSVSIRHPSHGEAIITDNAPLSEAALLKCLDDGLTPADWMRLLNSRVFFWPDEAEVKNHLRASARKSEPRTVLVIDTLPLVRAHHARVELAAINTGSTIRKPARRGMATFAPAHRYSYGEWQQLRGKRDRIKEVTVLDGVPDITRYIVDTYDVA